MEEISTESVFFDWFTFTIRIENLEDIFDFLKVNPEIFDWKEGATNHYTNTYNFHNILFIKYCEMNEISKSKYKIEFPTSYEINVVATGRAVREFRLISKYQRFEEMLFDLYKNDKLLAPLSFSRVDFSRDDKKGLLDIEKINRKIHKGEFISRLKSSMISSEFDQEKSRYLGQTLYLGKRDSNSEFFIRIYNKSGEIYSKQKFDKSILEEHHIRVEMVFKSKKQANPFMKKVFEKMENGEPLGELFGSTLNKKFTLLKRGLTTSRNPEKDMETNWSEFLKTTKRTTLGLEMKVSTIESKTKFFQDMEKTVAILHEAHGKEFFDLMLKQMIIRGKEKIDLIEQDEINEYKKLREERKEKDRLEFGRFDDGMDEYISE